MAIGDVVTIQGQGLETAGFLARDCAFPVTRFVQRSGGDEVLRNMPVYFGYWEDDSFVPVILDNTININTAGVVTACDTSIVTGTISEGGLIAPNQTKIKLKTETLVVDKLKKAFCKQRNISTRDLGAILNADGTFDMGNPYVIDFGRYALAQVNKALAEVLSQQVLNGDASDAHFGIDGLYTQLENGWQQDTVGIPNDLNHAIILNWQTLTGDNPATPDSVTTAGHTINLWGDTFTIPTGINLITLFDEYLVPAVEVGWTDDNGGVDVYEMHVPKGAKRCYQNASACMQPCGNTNGIWDTDLRDRFAAMRRTDVVEFYPSGRQVPMWESDKIAPNTMWFGPRSVGGSPTYGMIFRDMDTLFNELAYPLNETYGKGSGAFPANEPLIVTVIDQLPFEARAIHWDVEKVSMDCVEAGLMTIVGVLATMRHLWIKIENVACNSFVPQLTNRITIDNVPLDGRPAMAVQNTPANNAVAQSTTLNLVATAVVGATGYDFQVATDANFTNVVRSTTQAGVTYAVTPALTAATIYYWRERARNASGAGAWSTTRQFTTA